MKQKSAYFTKQKTKSKIIKELEKRVATKFNKKNKECIKMEVSKVNLGKGYIDIYNFGDIKLHCYQTNDLMNDESYILENNENVLLVEFPAFYDNLEEFEKYVRGLNKNIVGKVFSDHPNGGTILKDVKGYASKGTIKSMKEGTIHNLVTGFEKSFNGAFAKEYHEITNVLEDENVNIGGFQLKITYHDENIEIEFPQIGCVYTHMLGHDCHSIVAGEGHANVIIEQLKRYKANGYNLVLSSHYTPETLKDVDTKIAYLEELKELAKESKDATDFENKVKAKYPEYSGLNYLDMTAGFFFPQN